MKNYDFSKWDNIITLYNFNKKKSVPLISKRARNNIYLACTVMSDAIGCVIGTVALPEPGSVAIAVAGTAKSFEVSASIEFLGDLLDLW